ncbi:MAG: aldo/keto reductase [Myxococcales bacterium]|nr:aldo/keto reductase [Myxococcales bacterium]
MRYRMLGESGLRISELCLGTMTFGETWGFGADKAECRRIYDAYRGRGGNFIDTANKYTEGTSEAFVGEFIAGERGRVVLATKYTLATAQGDPNACGNHRKNMVQSVEASLRRLGCDYIDLYWVHAWDGITPLDEVMRALDDLVRAGKILYVGISDAPAWVVARANTLAELRGWSRFVGLQIEYSLIERTVERELVPMSEALGLGITAWAPLAGGVLTGKYHGVSDPKSADTTRGASNDRRLSQRSRAIAAEVVAIAAELGVAPASVAINWVRQRPCRPTPILGARTEAQIRQNLAALDFALCEEHLARLDAASAISLGFPHDFLGSEWVRAVIHGDTVDRLDAPTRRR